VIGVEAPIMAPVANRAGGMNPKSVEEITEYDHGRYLTYAPLLDAEAEGLDWRIGVHTVLCFDGGSLLMLELPSRARVVNCDDRVSEDPRGGRPVRITGAGLSDRQILT